MGVGVLVSQYTYTGTLRGDCAACKQQDQFLPQMRGFVKMHGTPPPNKASSHLAQDPSLSIQRSHAIYVVTYHDMVLVCYRAFCYGLFSENRYRSFISKLKPPKKPSRRKKALNSEPQRPTTLRPEDIYLEHRPFPPCSYPRGSMDCSLDVFIITAVLYPRSC